MALQEYDTIFRYLHILAGITWIGLLYFFNLVNAPLLKFKMTKPYSPDMAEKATAPITIKTLWWFRWGAMFTFIFGLLLIGSRSEAFGGMGDYFFENGWPGWFILIGVVLGITMWFNVWFLIWPNQQKILTNNKNMANAEEGQKSAMQAENAAAAKVAVNASRYNTWASIPMLFGMVFGAHGGGASDPSSLGSYGVELLIFAILMLAMIFFANRKMD